MDWNVSVNVLSPREVQNSLEWSPIISKHIFKILELEGARRWCILHDHMSPMDAILLSGIHVLPVCHSVALINQ